MVTVRYQIFTVDDSRFQIEQLVQRWHHALKKGMPCRRACPVEGYAQSTVYISFVRCDDCLGQCIEAYHSQKDRSFWLLQDIKSSQLMILDFQIFAYNVVFMSFCKM